jgi:hypothetical protein
MADRERRAQFDAEASQSSRWQQAAREFVLAANDLIDWYDPPPDPGDRLDLDWLTHAGSADASALAYPADVERVWSLLEHLESLLRATGTPCLPAVDLRARYRPPGHDVPLRG